MQIICLVLINACLSFNKRVSCLAHLFIFLHLHTMQEMKFVFLWKSILGHLRFDMFFNTKLQDFIWSLKNLLIVVI